MVMGQGVGTAAAMALGQQRLMAQLNVQELQNELRSDGVYLADVPGDAA